MERVSMSGVTVKHIMANGSKVKCMDMDNFHGLMGLHMKANTIKIKGTEWVL